MKKLFIIMTAAAALAAGGFTSQSMADDTPAFNSERGHPLQRLAQYLNLTDDQKTQIKTVLVGEKDTLAPLIGKLHDARKNLRDAIRASDASETSVRAASANVAAVESDLAVERLKLYGKIAPILTDAQRQKLADLQQVADDAVDSALARFASAPGN